MGMNVDLIDRDVYLPFPEPFHGPGTLSQKGGDSSNQSQAKA